MANAKSGEWTNLVLESSAHPPALPKERFRNWMAAERIFVSSRMDEQMNPTREAVRNYLHQMGASPLCGKKSPRAMIFRKALILTA